MRNIEKKIARLKKRKNAIILAHYYQTGDIIDVADMVGDSYGLSKKAKENDADIIVFCGVRFMAESAKILSPQKKVLLPAAAAGCPMADMVKPDDILSLRKQYPNAGVVCYVNSTYEVKAECDVCVTSSNAVKVVASLPQKQIIFVPDQNLARYVAQQLPDKEIIPYCGFCIVHHQVSGADVDKARASLPNAQLLVHPECTQEVVDKADFVGSTAGIIKRATQSDNKEFIIGTEMGILHVLQKKNPDKKFYLLSTKLLCSNMKKTKILDVYEALKYGQHEIILDEDIAARAKKSLDKMLELS
ncbi:MAG: quinolinate synthase NadA [Clostridia bacterium]|jgi:quinolinate synthase|nr:quinolinate synthase NadA [Clostridia bacterium]MBT7123215.1 quinolinate synthase NadA [Clostridia bacterium]